MLQETGVDEADLVKSDGRFIYTYAYENSARKPIVRVAETASGATLQVRGTVPLASGANTPMYSAGLYLHGGALVSVAGTRRTRSRSHLEHAIRHRARRHCQRWNHGGGSCGNWRHQSARNHGCVGT